MAVLANNSSGLFTAGATWSLVDATSFLNSEIATTATTVAFAGSSSFITGAITIDGIAVKVSTRVAVAIGTFSVRLFNVTDAVVVAGTTVTINVADMAVNSIGWLFMKFGASVLLLAGKSYRVEVSSSTAGQISLFRDGTVANWSRMLRTTTTQAPVAGDEPKVIGEWVSAGVNTTYTVTMDNTAVTTFGMLSVSSKAILQWQTTGATNYYLKLAGDLVVHASGTYICGTAGTPMPSTSTAKLEFVCSVNVEFGFRAQITSIVTMHGAVVTPSAKLVGDVIAGAVALVTDIATGWLSGDVIGIASTTRTSTQAESKALTANAVGTALTITALTNAHGGVAPVTAELINLTRNIQIFGSTTVLQGYVLLTDATISIKYVEFFNLGSATALKRGIDCSVATIASDMSFCSIHDFTVASSLGFNSSSAFNNFTLDSCVFFNTNSTAINIPATTGTAWVVSNCIAIKTITANSLMSFADMGGTVNNVTATSGLSTGITLGTDGAFTGAFSNLIAHSNAGTGISLVNVTATDVNTITTITSWRNNTNGLNWGNCFYVVINGGTLFGNTTANINSSAHYANCTMKNFVVNGGTVLVCPLGYNTGTDQSNIIVESSTFGSTSTHTTADFQGVTNTYAGVTFKNCTLSSATPVAGNTLLTNGSEIRFARFQQTAGNHRTYKKFGLIQIDTVIFNTASPSARMTPNNATFKLQGGDKVVAVPNTQTVTINVWVRKSVIGDGANYNGAQPRLILKADPAVGINADTVLATSGVANGVWTLLTGTTPAITDNGAFQFFVDCDGTTGFVNVDDWKTS